MLRGQLSADHLLLLERAKQNVEAAKATQLFVQRHLEQLYDIQGPYQIHPDGRIESLVPDDST